jgi:cytochrome o ubiquinol oxidase subunit 3
MAHPTTATEHHGLSDKVYFGFWIYIMTDLIVFAVLFTTFAVLRDSTFGGPSGKEIFDMPFVLTETMLLLISSFTSGLAMLAVRRQNKKQALLWLSLTFALGLSFLGMELYEFNHLVSEGFTWQHSAFLSAFFTLVGTHGLHITGGLLWLAILLAFIAKRGITDSAVRKLTLFSIFWHFLDVVWIFIFTIVYLMGVV